MAPKVFISYRVSDTRPTASRLAAELARRFGDDAVFLDHRSIEPGEAWPDRLATEAGRAAAVLVLIGKDWLSARDAG